MSEEFSKLSKDERDVRLTAFVLGELAESEAAEVRQAIATDAELARECERRKQTIELVRETAAVDQKVSTGGVALKLDDERRQKLLATFKTPAPHAIKPQRPRNLWYVPMSIAAVLVGLLAVSTLLPSLAKSKARASRITKLPMEETLAELAAEPANLHNFSLYAGEGSFQDRLLASKARGDSSKASVDAKAGNTLTVALPSSDFDADGIRGFQVNGQMQPFVASTPAPPAPKVGPIVINESMYDSRNADISFNLEQKKSGAAATAGKSISDQATITTMSGRQAETKIPDINYSIALPEVNQTVALNQDTGVDGHVALLSGVSVFSADAVGYANTSVAPGNYQFRFTGQAWSEAKGAKERPVGVVAGEAFVDANRNQNFDAGSASFGETRNRFYRIAEGGTAPSIGGGASRAQVSSAGQKPVGHFKAEGIDSLQPLAPEQPPTLNYRWRVQAEDSSSGVPARPMNASGTSVDFLTSAAAKDAKQNDFDDSRWFLGGVTAGNEFMPPGNATPQNTSLGITGASTNHFFKANLGMSDASGETVTSAGLRDFGINENKDRIDDTIALYVNGTDVPRKPEPQSVVVESLVNAGSVFGGSNVVMNFSDQSGFGAGGSGAGIGGYGGRTAFGNRLNAATSRAAGAAGGFASISDPQTAAEAAVRRGGMVQLPAITSADSFGRESSPTRAEGVSKSLEDLSGHGTHVAIVDSAGLPFTPTDTEQSKRTVPEFRIAQSENKQLAQVEPAKPTPAPSSGPRVNFANTSTTFTTNASAGANVAVAGDALEGRPAGTIQFLTEVTPETPKLGAASGLGYFFRKSSKQRSTNAGFVTTVGASDLARFSTNSLAMPQPMARTNRYAYLSQLTTDVSSDRGDINRPKPSASSPVPQPEILTTQNAFSTFSLNVADVSFKLAAASLERGAMPDVATIRSEEFINAFDYRDPQPAPGVPLAFAWERARYPFAHNRDALRFSIKTAAQGRDGGRPLNIVLLLDNSGSMERADRVRIIQESLRTLATQLQAQDKLSVVTFSRTATLRIDGVSGTNAAEVAKQIGALTPEGGTNLEEAMNLAYHTALRHYAATAINRVVLLTDGAANLGNVEPTALKAKVESFRKQGIALDCFGIGWEGLNDDLLEQLSRNGDGRYGFVNTPEEAASEFVGQLAGALRVAASDVKVQVEFNPKRVTAYRQVGYAKHQLTKEQFRDNKVDAAEIGASEAGNGIYIIETNPRGEGPIATVRARFRIPQTSDYREHEWVVPFGSAVELEQSSSAMRLAVSASAFSEWLAGSPFAGEVSTDRLLGILSGVPEVYGADPRPKRLEWMIRQAKSISGK